VPVFITTDSLLNAFHVLFEESIYRLEQANARKLPAVLARLGKNMEQVHNHIQGDNEPGVTHLPLPEVR
jgi:uncharacterized protein DUF3160